MSKLIREDPGLQIFKLTAALDYIRLGVCEKNGSDSGRPSLLLNRKDHFRMLVLNSTFKNILAMLIAIQVVPDGNMI